MVDEMGTRRVFVFLTASLATATPHVHSADDDARVDDEAGPSPGGYAGSYHTCVSVRPCSLRGSSIGGSRALVRAQISEVVPVALPGRPIRVRFDVDPLDVPLALQLV